MYSWVSKITSEIKIFNFGHLSSGHSIFTYARISGSGAIFRNPKGAVGEREREREREREKREKLL